MEYRQFEREFLRIAFTTSLDLSPASLAFVTGVPIAEVEKHFQRLVSQGVLEVTSDDEGHIRYAMPDRPGKPLEEDALAAHGLRILVPDQGLGGPPPPYPDPPFVAPPRAVVVHRVGAMAPGDANDVTRGQAVAAMMLNAMVCPGVGSIVGGRVRTGLTQLSLFLLGLPLIVVAIGLPIVAAWIWGLTTGAQLLTEARQPT